MKKPHITILGAGPAGLGAAFYLTRKKLADVTVVEQSERVGGNGGSFLLSGVHVDYGSHRLHPACDPGILKDIKTLLGDDLLDRPRHGRIRLRGRWIHFPLKPLDLALRLPLGFTTGTLTDLMGKLFKKTIDPDGHESFSSVMKTALGRTICREFYFPYAQKIWGLPPEELSVTQARRRVSANSFGKMFIKILSAIPGIKSNGSGRFFYPKAGFGQISDRLYQAAKEAGAKFCLSSRVKSVLINGNTANAVCSEQDGKVITHQSDYVWSTIPITSLLEFIEPSPPQSIINASKNIEYRSMILVYLVVEERQFSEYDAHYFPESIFPVTRVSEPKNYCNANFPENQTVLCAELPCFTGEPEWSMTDEELGDLVCNCLNSAGIPVNAPLLKVISRRLDYAYPVYRNGYEKYYDQVDQWLGQIDNFLTFGRQGLFVYDNTHHALEMACSAVKCFNQDGCFDYTKWKKFRQSFKNHVVED